MTLLGLCVRLLPLGGRPQCNADDLPHAERAARLRIAFFGQPGGKTIDRKRADLCGCGKPPPGSMQRGSRGARPGSAIVHAVSHHMGVTVIREVPGAQARAHSQSGEAATHNPNRTPSDVKRRLSAANLANACIMRLAFFGIWDQSELDERVAEALRLCREYAMPQHTATARIFEGYAIARRGDMQAGGAAIRGGLADYVAIGAVITSDYLRALLAETYAMQGETEEALAILTEALSEVKRTGERWGEAELTRQVGDVHRLKGGSDAAESHFAQAIEIARGQSAKTFELRAAVSLARLWSEQGKHVLGDPFVVTSSC